VTDWIKAASTRDPVELFGDWLKDAEAHEPNDANAVALATTDENGMPNVRMVLLKAFDDLGFVFYTNLNSAKGREIKSSPKVAMCFHWKSIRRQVRLRGITEDVSMDEADSYFNSRDRKSRLGAWASKQSEPMKSKRELLARVALFTAKFGIGTIPRPEHWSGIRLSPESIEFWQQGDYRIHERLKFTCMQGEWRSAILYP